MSNLIHVYQGAVTAGGKDGTLVSEGTGTNPIVIGGINALYNEESSPIKLALRCEDNYATTGNITIKPIGETSSMWALAPDVRGTAGTFTGYGQTLTISSVVTSTNTLFWVKAKAVDTETPKNDTTVDLQVQATIQSV